MQRIHFTTHCPNFGDDLNEDIWPSLAPALFDEDPHTAFVGIGTILGIPRVTHRRIHVFSTGAGYDPLSNWAGREITYHCVRGPVTARLAGLPADRVLSDGALLTPLVSRFPRQALGGGGICVMPHFQSMAFPGWAAACQAAGMQLLDPRGTTQAVIHALASADLVLTESMHGAILADTYGVAWRAFSTSGNFSQTKWVDWAASVGLDLELTALPPPSAGPLLTYGRPALPFGTTHRYTLDEALSAFDNRVVQSRPGSRWKHGARQLLLAAPALQRPLGFTPQRTAAALRALAGLGGMASREALRQELTSRMMDRLHALAAAEASVPA